MKRKLLSILIVLFLSFTGVEAMLRVVDPLGIAYFSDLTAFFRAATDDPTGYALPQGVSYFSHWSMTVGDDGLRVTPDADADGTTSEFLGDSVTMSWGVNDNETWVNLTAAALGLDARNYGRAAYNAANIEALMRETRGDHCAVFLTIVNDLEAPASRARMNTQPDDNPYLSRYFTTYLYLRSRAARAASPEHPTFDNAMRAISAQDNVLILAFDDGGYGDMVAQRYGAILIPHYTSSISFSDGHASALGNSQISAAAIPVIADWLRVRPEC
jgi:hypothetical protein